MVHVVSKVSGRTAEGHFLSSPGALSSGAGSHASRAAGAGCVFTTQAKVLSRLEDGGDKFQAMRFSHQILIV